MAALAGIKALAQCRHLAEMGSRQRRDADSIDIFGNRHVIDFVRAGEKRPYGDVETDIGKGRGDHLLATVMSVLAELGNKKARGPACRSNEFVNARLKHLQLGIGFHPRLPDTPHTLDLGLVAAIDTAQRIGHLADSGPRARSLDGGRHQVRTA